MHHLHGQPSPFAVNVLPANWPPEDFVARPVLLAHTPSQLPARGRHPWHQHPHVSGPPSRRVCHGPLRQLGRGKRPHTGPRKGAHPHWLRKGTPVDRSRRPLLRHRAPPVVVAEQVPVEPSPGLLAPPRHHSRDQRPVGDARGQHST
eukprot:47915-Rhodomonas_salina.1